MTTDRCTRKSSGNARWLAGLAFVLGGAMAASSAHADVVSTGTGFVINEDGLAVTNAHVVEIDNRGNLCRGLSARRGLDQFKVQYLARDSRTDLALVRIVGIGAPTGYSPAPAATQPAQPAQKPASSGGSWSLTGDDGGNGGGGSLDTGQGDRPAAGAAAASGTWVARIRPANVAVQQGESVFAVGYPHGFQLSSQHKINQGIVGSTSGLQGDVTRFQMSAAVNPGNSGGPVIDAGGNVIGVSQSVHLSTAKIIAPTKQGPKVANAVALQHTEGVKFAVQLSALHAFLAAHGARFETANAPANRSAVDLAREAGHYTIQLYCHK